MYLYNGPRGYANMRQFIMKGYKTNSKDVFIVPPEITYFQRRKRQLAEFMGNFMNHIDGAFHQIGFGHYSSYLKYMIVYSVISVGKF
jgi:hypothetical protein